MGFGLAMFSGLALVGVELLIMGLIAYFIIKHAVKNAILEAHDILEDEKEENRTE